MSNIENSILKLQEHQMDAYNNVEELYKNRKNAAIIFPTGCGKSFVILKYIEEHPDEKVLFLSPRCAINEQMYEYIVRYIGGRTESIEEIQEEFGSMAKAALSFIPGMKSLTYQSLLDLGKTDSMLIKILEKVKPDLIVVDEMHHIKTKNNTFGETVEKDENKLTEDEKIELRKQQNRWGNCFKKLLELCPDAKLLGLSATPIRSDGANVVERIFKNSIASEITLLEAIETGIILPPKYVVPDFIRPDELQSLLTKIENADERVKPRLIQEYNNLAMIADKMPGIPELMDEHITERNGKYVVFCEDIKDMEEKQAMAKEWFGKIDEEPTIYRVSSNHKDSNEQLEQFNDDDSDHLKIMYCVGMIDEGVHLKDVAGVILSAKTESRITYLQRIGRAISSGDSKKQALVIDLVNNNEILSEYNCRADGYQLTDIEAIEKLLEWIEEQNEGELPEYENGGTTKEKAMAQRMRRINNKYYKYFENEELLNELSDDKRKKVEEILAVGKKIGLWNEYIELDEDEKQSNISIDSFLNNIEIRGMRKELRDLLQEVKNAQKSLGNKSVDELIRICEILTQYGVDCAEIQLSERNNNTMHDFKLSELKIDNIDIKEIIEDNDLDFDFSFGSIFKALKKYYNGTKPDLNITEEQLDKAKKLGIIGKDKIEEKLSVLEILKENGMDLSKGLSKRTVKGRYYFKLSEIKQEEINIEEIIKEFNLDESFIPNKAIVGLRSAYNNNKKMSEEQRKRIEELGILSQKEKHPYLITLEEYEKWIEKYGKKPATKFKPKNQKEIDEDKLAKNVANVKQFVKKHENSENITDEIKEIIHLANELGLMEKERHRYLILLDEIKEWQNKNKSTELPKERAEERKLPKEERSEEYGLSKRINNLASGFLKKRENLSDEEFEELNEEEKEIILTCVEMGIGKKNLLIKRLTERKSKVPTGQDAGKAGFGSDTGLCDDISQALNNELAKDKSNTLDNK